MTDARCERTFLSFRFLGLPCSMVSDAFHNSSRCERQEDSHLEGMKWPFQQPFHASIQSLFFQRFDH